MPSKIMDHQKSHSLLGQRYRRAMVGLVDVSQRAAMWVLAAAVILTALCMTYTATHLTFDTDPLHLLDPDLPFRHLKKEFHKAFPELDDLIVVVIDAPRSSLAEQTADHLAEKLTQHKDLFSFIYQPGRDPYFEQEGLLYLDPDALWDLNARLTEWEPFLGSLTHDPSLRGFFPIIEQAMEKMTTIDGQTRLTQVFNWMSDTVEAQLAGQPSEGFWRETMLGSVSDFQGRHRRFLLAKPSVDYSSLQAADRPLETLRKAIHSLERQGPVTVRVTGSVAIDAEERQTVAHAAGVAVIVSFFLVCLILLIGFRSFRPTISMLVTLFMGLVWTAAFATLSIGTLNLISATAPIVFIGLGVDFGIQFTMRYREGREKGVEHALALRQAAFGVGEALTLAALASAVCFFSFLPTSYRGLAELGFIAGIGMVVALLANLTVLPALLTILPIHPAPPRVPRIDMPRLTVSAIHHRRGILLVTIVAVMSSLILLPHARFDFNPLHLKDPSSEAVATFLDLLADPDTTPYTIDILARDLSSAQQLGERLNKLKEVKKTMTLASFIPTNQEEKLSIIDDMALVLEPLLDSSSTVPSPPLEEEVLALDSFQRSLVRRTVDGSTDPVSASMKRLNLLLGRLQQDPGWPDQSLQAFKHRLLGELTDGLNRLRNLLTPHEVTLKDLPASLRDRYLTSDKKARLEVFPVQDGNDNAALRRFVRAVQGITPKAIGTPVAMVEAGDAIVTSCLQATSLALAAALILFLLVLRSVRDALLVLAPLLLTLLLTLSASALLDLPFNLANIVALPLVLGLGIAFGLYLILREREGIDIDRLIYSSTSRAVLYSVLTTMATFGSLSFANHRGMASMGLLLTLTLTLALLCSLLILPAIMAELENRGWWSAHAPSISIPVGKGQYEGEGHDG